ncbi:probable RNA polymerase II nuclear localization protein SLC7A6OS isoform X2 [Daphnia pulicaria]|uniref:probable RNA polymerase II nuclear localization protein SLC7A6OS isoform X2 n=1 Tax=Daphnia pulicaria TaxID=35523 RepID=UPI001EEB3EFD|nr:probable RNA polymerase II nuclear localization protein SLC7A6OS isoform X2 [Daphnia pulicaria]
MTSIVRIKRRQSQEPAEALVLATKRIKVEGSEQAVEENIFRFCGSTENEEENLQNIAKLVEKGKLLSHRQTLKAYKSSSFQSRKEESSVAINSEKKYKVLNTFRDLDATNTMKVYDLVLEEHEKGEIATCNGIPLVVEKCEVLKENEKECVFDLYYCEGGTFDDSYIDRLMSVQPYYNSGDHEDSETDHSDDSNDENNYRNEYPDTDPDEEQGDEDVIGKMSGMYLDATNELSSDDDDFIYSKDDYPRHGDAYANFKIRVMKDLQGSDYESDSDDQSDDQIVECLD